jgi:hypothetical protein
MGSVALCLSAMVVGVAVLVRGALFAWAVRLVQQGMPPGSSFRLDSPDLKLEAAQAAAPAAGGLGVHQVEGLVEAVHQVEGLVVEAGELASVVKVPRLAAHGASPGAGTRPARGSEEKSPSTSPRRAPPGTRRGKKR